MERIDAGLTTGGGAPSDSRPDRPRCCEDLDSGAWKAELPTVLRNFESWGAERRPPRPTSLTERAVVGVLAPAWVTISLAEAILVLATGGRPAFFLHSRHDHRSQTNFWLPKISTLTNSDRTGGEATGLCSFNVGCPTPQVSELMRQPRWLFSWLRSTGLDELPQLALVVTGRLRLVGPRPVTREESSARTGVMTGGLTGLWQVLDRHRYCMLCRDELDAIMLQHWSKRLYWCILFATLRNGLLRR